MFDEPHYQLGKNWNSYREQVSADMTIPDDKIQLERFDILAKDLKKHFGVKTSSTYLAILIHHENGTIRYSYAFSGGNFNAWGTQGKGTQDLHKKWKAEDFVKRIRDLKIPHYIRY